MSLAGAPYASWRRGFGGVTTKLKIESDWTDEEAKAFGDKWLAAGGRLAQPMRVLLSSDAIAQLGPVPAIFIGHLCGSPMVIVSGTGVTPCPWPQTIVPDFRYPDTRGHALEQLREAWSAPRLHFPGYEHYGWWPCAEAGEYLLDANGERVFPQGQCESEAMLAAMEAYRALAITEIEAKR